MTLTRLIARPLLAAIFVVQGARTLRDPDRSVPRAKPVTDQLVPMLKKVAPDRYADLIPEDTRTLVRLNAAVQLGAGLALAAGKFSRPAALALAGSLLPTTLAGHAFWHEDDPMAKNAQFIQVLKNAGLTGGLLLAAVDTEGRPGLLWRARHGAVSARKASQRAVRDARRQARALTP